MRRVSGIVMILSICVGAPARADETVGRWRIQSAGGTCSASTALGDNELLMVFSKPPGGENEGGIMIGNPVAWKGKIVDGPAAIELTGQGSVTGKHDGRGYADLSGYWLPFVSAGELDNYPDAWRIKASKDGQVLIDKPITEFKAAVAALQNCGKKSG